MAKADVVGSLFGPTPEELAQERNLMQQQFMQRAQGVNPYYASGAGVGMALGSLFNFATGREAPEVRKAKKIQSVLQGVTSSLPEEQRGNRAAVMNRVAEVFAQDPELEQEAIKATLQAAEFAKDDINTATNVAYKEALIKSAEDTTDRKNISTAYNAGQGLKSLLEANVDPEKFDTVYNSTVEKLKKKGIDTSFLEQAQDIEEKVAGVDYLISLGTSEKTRSASKIAEQRQQIQERTFLYKQKLDQAKMDIQKYGIESREGIAAKGRAAAMERALVTAGAADKRLSASENNIMLRDALSSRSKEIQEVDTEFQTKLDIKTLAEDFGLPLKDAQGAVKNYQAKLKDYLNVKDENGAPLYSMAKAQDLARQDFRAKVKPGEGFFGKPSYSKDQPSTEAAPPTNLLTEGKTTKFKNGQSWTLKNGKPVQVK